MDLYPSSLSDRFYNCVEACMEDGWPYGNSRQYCYEKCNTKHGTDYKKSETNFIGGGGSPIFSAYEKVSIKLAK